jgi:hypothetical protein
MSGLDRDKVWSAYDQAVRLPAFGGIEVRRTLPCVLGCFDIGFVERELCLASSLVCHLMSP